jgi:hypothetical protein
MTATQINELNVSLVDTVSGIAKTSTTAIVEKLKDASTASKDESGASTSAQAALRDIQAQYSTQVVSAVGSTNKNAHDLISQQVSDEDQDQAAKLYSQGSSVATNYSVACIKLVLDAFTGDTVQNERVSLDVQTQQAQQSALVNIEKTRQSAKGVISQMSMPPHTAGFDSAEPDWQQRIRDNANRLKADQDRAVDDALRAISAPPSGSGGTSPAGVIGKVFPVLGLMMGSGSSCSIM